MTILFPTISYAENLNVLLDDNTKQQEYISAIFVDENISITDITFSTTLIHEYPADLRGQLISPDGDIVFVLFNPVNIPANTMHTFTASPSTVNAMNNFIGDNAYGVWRFTIGDYAPVDTGTVESWNVLINGNLVANPTTITNRVIGYWANPNQMYYCDDSLAYLNVTNNVDPCNDLAESANRWNAISDSEFTLTRSLTSNNNIVVTMSPMFDDTTLARVVSSINIVQRQFIVGGTYMEINHMFVFGDVNRGDFNVHHYDTVMTHEIGHIVGMGHNLNPDSVMFENISLNDDNAYNDEDDSKIVMRLY